MLPAPGLKCTLHRRLHLVAHSRGKANTWQHMAAALVLTRLRLGLMR